MYCREGQQTEEDMYNNEEGGPAFEEFLELIGQKVRLKGFAKYKAGLCNKSEFGRNFRASEDNRFDAYPSFLFARRRFHRLVLGLRQAPGKRGHVPRLHPAALHA